MILIKELMIFSGRDKRKKKLKKLSNPLVQTNLDLTHSLLIDKSMKTIK